jgi:hypothetical protein
MSGILVPGTENVDETHDAGRVSRNDARSKIRVDRAGSPHPWSPVVSHAKEKEAEASSRFELLPLPRGEAE